MTITECIALACSPSFTVNFLGEKESPLLEEVVVPVLFTLTHREGSELALKQGVSPPYRERGAHRTQQQVPQCVTTLG